VLERYSREWIRAHLPGYTGMANVETIGGRIIEAHLRFADQWPDLYGDEWLEAVVRLYEHRRWAFADGARTEGYSVVLFGPHGRRYAYPAAGRLGDYRAAPGISSVQITFLADRPPCEHVMPPGGFRLAVINSASFRAALRLRELMARDFGLIGEGAQAATLHAVERAQPQCDESAAVRRSASEPRSSLKPRATPA
jgi:hypothetical protein